MQPSYEIPVLLLKLKYKNMRINLITLTALCLMAVVSLPLAAQRTAISVSEFDQVSMARSGTVYVTQGNETKVEVVASDDVLEDLDIEVRGKELIIKNKRMRGWNGRSGKLEVYVITPEIKGLSVSGSGKLVVQNKLDAENLRMAVSGSGKIICGMNAKSLNIAISGSGNAELSGSCGDMNGAISGSGGIRGEDLRVENLEVTISGSGSCEIHVNESIEARISGSGSVRYSGNPQHVNSKTSGSGSVKKVG